MEKRGCIKGENFDFIITHIDCQGFVYEDASIWMTGPNYKLPEYYDVFIGRGSGAGIKVSVRTEGHTVIRAETLGTSGVLPDGLWCIRSQKFCPHQFTRYRMMTCRLECCLQEYISGLYKSSARDGDFERVRQIEDLVAIAKHSAEVGNVEQAIKTYDEARQAVEDLNCECKCLKPGKNGL